MRRRDDGDLRPLPPARPHAKVAESFANMMAGMKALKKEADRSEEASRARFEQLDSQMKRLKSTMQEMFLDSVEGFLNEAERRVARRALELEDSMQTTFAKMESMYSSRLRSVEQAVELRMAQMDAQLREVDARVQRTVSLALAEAELQLKEDLAKRVCRGRVPSPCARTRLPSPRAERRDPQLH